MQIKSIAFFPKNLKIAWIRTQFLYLSLQADAMTIAPQHLQIFDFFYTDVFNHPKPDGLHTTR
jgi:hypothetical protein